LGVVAGAKVLKDLLVGVAPFDLITHASVSLLFALVAVTACYVLVRRAMRVDPVLALRYEMNTMESAGELVRFGRFASNRLNKRGSRVLEGHPFERNLNPPSELR
jgi:hypothetical protein